VDGAHRPRIDEQREVRVAVDVDEARRDGLPGRVELPPRLGDVADRDDPSPVDADVGLPRGPARAVDGDPAEELWDLVFNGISAK
jgi:hypothetical protein